MEREAVIGTEKQSVSSASLWHRADVFDDSVLQKYIDSLPEGFDLVRFDENIYNQAMQEEWSKEFCEVFSSSEDYLTRGFGFAVLKNGRLVSGASTMTVYDSGIEIQVATDKKYRRRGLAISCSSFLRHSMPVKSQ
jgi:hypothetical protein